MGPLPRCRHLGSVNTSLPSIRNHAFWAGEPCSSSQSNIQLEHVFNIIYIYVCIYIYLYHVILEENFRRSIKRWQGWKKCAVSRLGVVLHTLLQDRPGFMASIYYINSINNSNITWIYRTYGYLLTVASGLYINNNINKYPSVSDYDTQLLLYRVYYLVFTVTNHYW